MNKKSIPPRIPKQYLLLVAALVWTFAGVMLLVRGFIFLQEVENNKILRVAASAVAGSLFYWLLFSKISFKHIQRIVEMENERPNVFSFFNIKSYVMMSVMISGGVLLRKSGILAPDYMAFIYITMGIPLSASAFRFYYRFVFYKK